MSEAITPSTDPALVVLANKALIAARPALTRAGAFVLDVSDDAVAPGTTLKVAIYDSAAAAAYNATSNNYGTGTGSISFAPVTFSQYIKSYQFTDAQLTEVPEALFNRAGEAAGVGCGLAVDNAIKALFVAANMTGTALTVASGTTALTKDIITNMVSQCATDPARTVLVLNKSWFYPVLSLFDAAAWGGPEAIRSGILSGGPFGLKAIECVDMPAASSGIVGCFVPEEGIVAAIRKVPCASTNAYDEVVDQTDPESGFGFQIRRYADPSTGTNNVSASVMIGAAVAQKTKFQKITVAS